MGAAATRACTAFAGIQRLAAGSVRDVTRAVKTHINAYPESQVLVFDNITTQLVEFNLRGTVEDVLTRPDRATPSVT